MLPVLLILAVPAAADPGVASDGSTAVAAGLDDAALLAGLSQAVRSETLDNGLRVIIAEDHRAPVFALQLQAAGGASLDLAPPGGCPARPGLAHLVEHLLFAGSPAAPAGDYDALLSAVGAENNAWTEQDAMALHLVGPVEALDLALALEADRMAALDRDSVAERLPVELAVVERERAIARDTPGGRDGDALRALIFPAAHPYAAGIDGTEATLASTSVDDVIAFHAAAWAPGNVVLSLVGDLDPDDALARVRAAFAPVPARPGPALPAVPASPALAVPGGHAAVHFDNVDSTSVYSAWPLPPTGDADAAALDLLTDVLADRQHGRLSGDIRRGRLEGAESWTWHGRLGSFLVLETRASDRPADAQRRDHDRLFARLSRHPADATELSRAKARWRSWAARALQDPEERAEILAGCLREHDDPDCFSAHVADHLAVTPDDVAAAARRWLAPDDRDLLVVTSTSESELPTLDLDLFGTVPPSPPLTLASPAPIDRPLPDVPTPSPWAPPEPALLSLSDGTPVWLLERPEVPLVRIAVSLRRGVLQADDPLSLIQAGALLDEGSAALSATRFQDALADLGAEASLGVGMARAWAEVEVPTGGEAAALPLVVDALVKPRFPARRFRQQRRRAARDAADAWLIPGTLHAMAVQRALYPADHPLGRVFSEQEQRHVRRRQLRRAWREELALGSPAVAVAGDTTPERILPVLERALATLPARGEAPEPLPSLPAPPPGPRTLLVDVPGLERVFVSALLTVPEAFSPEQPALELLHRALSAEYDSRLSRLLREQTGWTYGVHGLLRVWPGHGVMEIRFAVDPSVLPDALAAVRDEIAAVAAEPPRGEELRRARAALRRDAALRQLRLSRSTHQLAVLQGWGGPPDEDRRLLAATGAMSAADLDPVAALLDPDGLVWVLTGDRDAVEPLLDDSGWPLTAIRSARAIVDGDPPLPL